ncbi:MAG: hypothetical protein ACOYML_08545 [Microthrixaceae bacterium]
MTPDAREGAARVRLGSWMVIAGSLGAILALLTWFDIWQVSDTRPTGWGIVTIACFVLTLAGFVVLWRGLTERAQAEAAAAAARSDNA